VELPDNRDVNDFFQEHDLFDFQTLLNQAQKFDLPGIISIDTALNLLLLERQRNEENQGLFTPWENVNRISRGFKPGDLIIVAAPPKIGKTTWCLDIARYQALQGVPVLFFCLEMRPERLARKIIQAICERECPTDDDDIRTAMQDLKDLPLYLAHSFKKEKLEDVLSLIREAIKRYDLKLIIFDNLHYLARSISNVNEEVGQAAQAFKLLAEEMEIPIILIAQPRKQENRNEVMRADDIKYSNAVHADCDQMIILHRKRIATKAKKINPKDFVSNEESFDSVTLVRIEAHRYGPGGETLHLLSRGVFTVL
jgi:replicative DNA helicase